MATKNKSVIATALNDENASPSLNLSDSNAGGKLSASRKSLIPLPKTSPSPSSVDENKLKNKTRRPLLIQNNSPAVGRRPSESTPKKPLVGAKATKKDVSSLKDVGTVTTTPVNKLRLVSGVPKTPVNSPSKAKQLKGKKKEVKEVEESEEESLSYWKELCESRRVALEDALKENYELHQEVEELKKENAQLEEMVLEAKKLAEMIEEAAEELQLDESGICDSEAVAGNEVSE